MTFSPPLVQPPSRDETAGDQLEGDNQVSQALSLEHVCPPILTLKCPTSVHPLRLDKFHARSRICVWGRFLEGLEPHNQVVFCISRALQMGGMGVRIVGYSNVIKYRMCQSCTLLSNLSVVACRRNHHPSAFLQTVSISHDPFP